MSEHLTISEDRIGHLVLGPHGPDASALLASLDEAVRQLRKDHISALVIRGDGTGAWDLSQVEEDASSCPAPAARLVGQRFRERGNRLVRRLDELHLPIIAAVTGPARGLGLAMALIADLRLATPDAVLGGCPKPASRVGYGIPWLLTRAVGDAIATQLVLGRELTADRAAELGVFLEVVPGDRLTERATQVAQDLLADTANPARALQALRAARALPLDEAMLYASYTVQSMVTAEETVGEDHG